MSDGANVKMEALSQKILDNARKQSKKIIDRAERDAEKVVADAERNGRTEAESIVANAQKRAESESRRISATIPLAVKRRVLEAEESILQGMLEFGLDAAAETSAKEPGPVLRALILDAALIVPEGCLIVEAKEEHRAKVTAEMLDGIAVEVKKQQDRSIVLRLSDAPADIIGGVIVRGESGRVMCNNSFEARLKRAEEDLRLKLAKILFKEQEV